MENKKMLLQIIRIKSGLTEEELLKVAKERSPQFKAIKGIIQKYYIKLGPEGEYGGVYIWDSEESLLEFQGSGLAKSIPEAYKVLEPPKIEIQEVLFQLRD
jgi:heme-degrading monooxygenase HmoA